MKPIQFERIDGQVLVLAVRPCRVRDLRRAAIRPSKTERHDLLGGEITLDLTEAVGRWLVVGEPCGPAQLRPRLIRPGELHERHLTFAYFDVRGEQPDITALRRTLRTGQLVRAELGTVVLPPAEPHDETPTRERRGPSTHVITMNKESSMPLKPGIEIANKFKIIRRIGSTAMSEVYEVEDRSETPPVRRAMKVMTKGEMATPPGTFTRVVENEYRCQSELAEAEVLGVLRTYWFGRDREHDRAYLVMDLLPGARPLRLREGPLEERLRRVLRAAQVVARAHEKGVVHRDLKPENLLEDGHGRVFMIDYGLAHALHRTDARVEPAGTAPYASPEQLDPHRASLVDRRADVHALGVLLCEAVTRAAPASPARAPREPAGSRALLELCAASVDRDPARRPPDAHVFAKRLQDVLNDAMPDDPETHRLYIDDELFLRVDAAGNYLGEFHEGALGVVVQVESDRRDGGKYALKLPRLLADTHRENAYITKLLELEAAVISKMGGDGLPTAPGLSFTQSPVNTLKRPLHLTRHEHPYAEQEGQYLFVQFQKGGAPRFCGVAGGGPDRGARVVPGHAELEFLGEKVAELESARLPIDGGDWRTAGVLDPSDTEEALRRPAVFSLDEALGDDQCERTWYAVMPSVVYRWAHGTLQEAIGRGELAEVSTEGERHSVRPWGPLAHLELARVLLQGVDLLHRRKQLHADLRPANVMYQESPHDPAHFALIDFGSLSTDDRVSTAIGAAVAGGRRSPFYAPERLGSVEHESADVAVFLQDAERAKLRIVLGWRRDLLRNDAPIDMTEVQTCALDATESEILPGDRVQIRDYVFDVERVGRWRGALVLETPVEPWQILQSRIVMRVDTSRWQPPTWLPISRVLVLQQWSAATDVYSIGAILLYALFSAGIAAEGASLAEKDVDAQFGDMISYLASSSFLVQVGPTVQQVRDDLRWLVARPAVSELGAPDVTIKRGGEEMTYLQWAYKVASVLVHTAPGSNHVLRALGNNVAYFVLVMHFALRCLHRGEEGRDVLTGLAAPGTGARTVVPFCPSRCTRPDEKVADLDGPPAPGVPDAGAVLPPREAKLRVAELALAGLQSLIGDMLTKKLQRFEKPVQTGNFVAVLPTYQLFALGESCTQLRERYTREVAPLLDQLQAACRSWAAAAESRTIRSLEDSPESRKKVQGLLGAVAEGLPAKLQALTREFDALGKLLVQARAMEPAPAEAPSAAPPASPSPATRNAA